MKIKSPFLLIIAGIALVAGLALLNLVNHETTPESTIDKVSSKLESLLTTTDKEAAAFLEDLDKGSSHAPSPRRPWFFIYDNTQLVSWSDNRFVPTRASVADTFKLKLLKSGSADYLAKKWRIDNDRFLIAVIPLYRKFKITNQYLQNWWNAQLFASGDISVLDHTADIGLPVCAQGQCPFKINFPNDSIAGHEFIQRAGTFLMLASIVLLIIVLYSTCRDLTYPEVGLVLLYGFLYGTRYAMVEFAFPNIRSPGWVFNPQVFASSNLNASLGDLFLNELALFVLCLYLFKNYQRFSIFQHLFENTWKSWIISIFAGTCILFALLFPYVSIQTIYNNSGIVLDISQSLNFNSIRLTAIVIILLSGVCSFLFAHTFIRLLVADGNNTRVMLCFFISAVLFAAINTQTGQQYESSLLLGSIYFFMVYFLKLYAGLRRLTFATFSYLFIAVSFLSANGAYGIHRFSIAERIENQFRFADNFLIDRDIFGEYLLDDMAKKITNDAFIQTRINIPILSREAVRQKIRQIFIPSYFNKYDVEIWLFAAAGEPLNNRTDASLSQFIGNYDQAAYRTAYDGVYFIQSPARDVSQKYLVKIPIMRSGFTAAYVMLELSLKKIIPENVYPELLVDNSVQQYYNAEEISYAVYSDTTLLFSSGKFNYDHAFSREWLGNPVLYHQGLVASGYMHIAQEDQNHRVAIVSSQQRSDMYALANFSFLLVLGLVIILFFIFIEGIANYINGEKLYFSARIQLLLNLAFFLPLILVSVTTLNLTSHSSQDQLNAEYRSKADMFSSQLSAQLDSYLNQRNETAVSFENQVTDLAKLTNLDANVYTSKGELLATSQPQIFENELVSSYVNPHALSDIRNGENVVIETERVGSLEFYVSYAALKAPLSGKLIGILGIPFFQSAYSMEKVQINIVANILNIFALIFIGLVILSYFVSVWLTFPLKFITQSLQRTSLTKVNQPLKWKAEDEIGLMVKEYNQMLFKLSESKAELEQTQRERTWREIAQQVAHEIKNPLTPMKLTIQQLQRTLASSNLSVEKTEKALSSLLTQVNTLNDIASSFSTFAKMPEPVMQRLELVTLIRRIILLHSQSGDLTFTTSFREAYVMGDEQLLGRTFSNIILNAFQASRPGQPRQLKVSLEPFGENIVLEFRDNGKGIEPDIAERIFLSHFSTKKSGSGLGLAIAKQAIEQMNGKIWFETVVGQGTTFFIELPSQSHS
ncbi:MAG: HAMP domain-containing sensor histidine kinase [Chryseolinea sp.]